MNLSQGVNSTIQQRDLAAPGGRIVVGVSGGTDSLALLHILAALRAALEIELHAATLDHGLRGGDGADDARFVVAMAQSWGIPVTAGFTDVNALAAERKLSIEAAARIARYDFLARVARDVGADRVAVAHNADDQVETVLMHLLRGAGITGLTGMAYLAPLPEHPDLLLIRPLLDVPRADLDAYCRQHALYPRHDTSNDDQTYTRNRLRHDLIPHLRDLSPQVERRLIQLAEIAALEDEFARESLQDAIAGQVVLTQDRVSLPRAVFATLHPALQRRFLLWALSELDALDAASVHLKAAVDVALAGQVGAVAQFPHGLQLRVGYESIYVERGDPVAAGAAFDDLPLLPRADKVIPLTRGVTSLNARWSIEVADHEAALTPQIGQVARLEIAADASLLLRARRPGDRFAPPGLEGHSQKLSKWMIDRKIPREVRDRLPLLVMGDHIVAIYWQGWVISASYGVRSGTNGAIYVNLLQKAAK